MKTFVVRIFIPSAEVLAHAAAPPALRGLAEEIGGPRNVEFTDGEALLAFLATASRETQSQERSKR